MQQRGAQAYRGVAIASATPTRLLDELFARALLECQRARQHMAQHDLPGKGRAIGKVVEIVAALEAALAHEAAPALARNLERLYQFVQERVLRASQELDPAPLLQAERILTILRDGFAQAAAAAATAPPPAGERP